MTTAQIDIRNEIKKRLAEIDEELRGLKALEEERAELRAALDSMEAVTKRNRPAPLPPPAREVCHCGPNDDCIICKWGF